MPSREWDRLMRVAKTRRRVEREYPDALRAAHGAGYTFAELARGLGVSRQAIQQALTRAPSPSVSKRKERP